MKFIFAQKSIMKIFTLFIFITTSFFSCVPISEEERAVEDRIEALYENVQSKEEEEESAEFDEDLADELGADQYGMKQYIFANLIAGPKRDQDSNTAALLQRAHLDNITKLAETGKLVLAGPFLDDGEVRGIYIFDVKTIEEARKLTETDPAIKAGRLRMELRPWYGSAALLKVNEIGKKVVRTGI